MTLTFEDAQRPLRRCKRLALNRLLCVSTCRHFADSQPVIYVSFVSTRRRRIRRERRDTIITEGVRELGTAFIIAPVGETGASCNKIY